MDVLLYYFCASVCLLQGLASASCGFPGSPAHCRVSFSDDHLAEGAVAMYECERGFELLGPSRRVCGPLGQWIPDGIPFCVINVAAGKAPMQTSTEDGGLPQRALDGSTASSFVPETCTLTKPERVPWWYVNLLEPYMVQLVRLDFGKPCCGTNEQATIVIRVGNNRPDLGTNPVCNTFVGFIREGQPLFLPCNPPMPGAFVSVHLESGSSYSQLSICEAFVYTDQALPIERCPQFRDQPPGSTATYNGKCYIFYDRQPANFRDALGFCRSRGGTLVDESNPALQGFISWELWRRHRSDSSSQYWMGAVRDPQDTTNWKWVNGNEVTISFWNALTANGEDCARFDGTMGWLWTGADCQSRMNYICQHRPKTCGYPEQPPNSTMVSEGFQVGASVEYSCDEGHLLVGPTVRTCLDTGFYDEFPPVCKYIECGFPAAISHGSYELINGTVSYLSHVQYSCNSGYEMMGRSRLVCDIDERWNGPPPRCDVLQCEAPQAIANGRVVANSTAFGSVAEYTCVAGFKLRGPRIITCLASGLWDYPPPTCLVEERLTTSTTTTSSPTTVTSSSTTPSPFRVILSSRRPIPRPSSPSPFIPSEATRRPRPWTTERPATTDRPSTKQDKTSVTIADSQDSHTSHVPHIIVANHPKENQIIGSGNNIRTEQTPGVNVPTAVDSRAGGSPHDVTVSGARFNIGAVVALAVFGGLVFFIAIVSTIIILARSNKQFRDKHGYRHHQSADCHTVATQESTSSASGSGLHRQYRQAWEELHEAAGGRRGRRPDRSSHHDREPVREGSELVINEAYSQPRRHHHHHHRERYPAVQTFSKLKKPSNR